MSRVARVQWTLRELPTAKQVLQQEHSVLEQLAWIVLWAAVVCHHVVRPLQVSHYFLHWTRLIH